MFRTKVRWEKSRTRGHAIVKRRSSRKKLRGAVARFTEWIRENRHEKIGELMKSVADKHRGHWNYYGVIGNSKSLGQYRTESCRALFKWVNRRSQKRSYTWRAFNRLLQRFAVPMPRIVEGAKEKLGLKDKPGWNEQQVRGMNLLGAHYQASRA